MPDDQNIPNDVPLIRIEQNLKKGEWTIDFYEFEDPKTIISYCSAEALNEKDIFVEAYRKGWLKKTTDYLQDAATVVVVGNAVEFSEEVYKRSLILGQYPGYGMVFSISKEIQKYLVSNGYHAKIARNISQKTAAIAAGLGVWGKNSLVLNKEFGTHLRFDSIVTNWIPDSYPKPLMDDLCKDCHDCIDACPHLCLTEYKVNALCCNCKYVNKKNLNKVLSMCPICQKACKYNGYN